MLFFVPFSKTNERHKFALFYRRVTTLRDGFQTDYHWKGRHKDVTARSVNHFDDSIQLSTQSNMKLQTLADCDINCTVYNGLQLLYKEKVKEDLFYIQGFTICKPFEIRDK